MDASTGLGERLESIYSLYNRREYVHPDPLEFLYDYPDPADREVAGLMASALAYGNVRRILKSVSSVLDKMGPKPVLYLLSNNFFDFENDFSDFVHRFARGGHVAALLAGAKKIIQKYGSLHECMSQNIARADPDVLPGLTLFAAQLWDNAPGPGPGHLVPRPEKGSACKRFHLFLRWMVRCDAVDPGGWDDISASLLIVPLDVHMFRVARRLCMTSRRQAGIKAAIEVTEGFKRYSPDDPVKYDFALTRFGIRGDIPDPVCG
ncbi:MAG: TIGR02757 family protein [Deltaproteobacteria bacterium]|nr:TIGR02757 family protein [Deltaproteobacteria bacterium]